MVEEVIKIVKWEVKGFELISEPFPDSINIKPTKKGFIVSYLTPDEDAPNPIEYWDGNGKFFHSRDYGKEQERKYAELLGYDPDTREKVRPDDNLAVRIDKFEHGVTYYSLEGEGTQDRWDTSRSWAVWYPDESAMEDIKRFKTKKAQRKRAIEIARQSCELFNQWANGEVYRIVTQTFDRNKNLLDTDAIGGYFGWKDAMKELKTLKFHSDLKRMKTSSKKKLGEVI